MAGYFLDSSALGKNDHAEVGTAEVERLLKEPVSRHFISRLTTVEIQSVFAGKSVVSLLRPTFSHCAAAFLPT